MFKLMQYYQCRQLRCSHIGSKQLVLPTQEIETHVRLCAQVQRNNIAEIAIWNRKHLAVIERWYPSSKTCHECGAVNAALTLADRNWTCICGAHLDRDFNAALNVRTEGVKILAAGHAESLNARGPGLRLPRMEAIGVEA
jgi:hypothetical protein